MEHGEVQDWTRPSLSPVFFSFPERATGASLETKEPIARLCSRRGNCGDYAVDFRGSPAERARSCIHGRARLIARCSEGVAADIDLVKGEDYLGLFVQNCIAIFVSTPANSSGENHAVSLRGH